LWVSRKGSHEGLWPAAEKIMEVKSALEKDEST